MRNLGDAAMSERRHDLLGPTTDRWLARAAIVALVPSVLFLCWIVASVLGAAPCCWR
jgi:hypothetical protein